MILKSKSNVMMKVVYIKYFIQNIMKEIYILGHVMPENINLL